MTAADNGRMRLVPISLVAATALALGFGAVAPAVAFADDAAQGGLPNGQRLSPFDLSAPAVYRLDPALLDHHIVPPSEDVA